AAQWMLAPTDFDPNDPTRIFPELRPQVIANGWTADRSDPWFGDVVRAWTAAGIFATFAAGDGGPACGSAAAPADDPDAFVVGAFGPDGRIADFSGRGGSPVDGDTKPDIAAPGVAIRSSVPGGYATYSGTAMAAANAAGAVALMWSAQPSLRGQVGRTRLILERGAVDQADTSCGGT